MKRTRQAGFTIIELVMVIVILGILAAIALPKYVSLQTDARKAKLNGAKGAIASAMAMSHGKALVDGVAAQATATQTSEGVTVTLAYGYPNAASIAAAAGISAPDYTITPATPTTAATVSPSGVASATTCSVVYTQAINATTTPATISIDQSDCS
jgi:MSHA pilin protein MshA